MGIVRIAALGAFSTLGLTACPIPESGPTQTYPGYQYAVASCDNGNTAAIAYYTDAEAITRTVVGVAAANVAPNVPPSDAYAINVWTYDMNGAVSGIAAIRAPGSQVTIGSLTGTGGNDFVDFAGTALQSTSNRISVFVHVDTRIDTCEFVF
ncbi:MAG: hypothetical protein WBD02_03215 [Acidimicrobiia bacterium]